MTSSKVQPGNWIVLANSARAVIVDDPGAEGPLTVIHVLRHPESRRNAGELVTDRPSRSQSPTGTSAALMPRTDPHRNAQEHFAAELAEMLDDSRRRNLFSGLVVAASNPFLGLLLGNMKTQVKKQIQKTIERDFTEIPLIRLRERLADA